MNEIVALLLGVPIGVATGLVSWWLLFHVLGPRLSWGMVEMHRIVGGPGSGRSDLAVRLRNKGSRDAIDVDVHGELRVDHPVAPDGVTRTVIRLPINSAWVPRIRSGSEVRIRTAEPEIPQRDWDRLNFRCGTNVNGIEDLLAEIDGAAVRFYALANDAFSGARQIFVSDDSLIAVIPREERSALAGGGADPSGEDTPDSG